MTSCAVLVVAAGRGARMGAALPKQWQDLGGRPLLRHALDAFAGRADVDFMQVVINPDDRGHYDRAVAGLALGEPVAGGASRQDSVRLGLEALAALSPDLVLIHDAARPFVESATIGRVIEALGRTDGAVPALPVHDSLKRGKDGVIAESVSRDGLFRVQTPQGFRFPAILAAHRRCRGADLTDDAAVAAAAGLGVALIEGSEDNRKITTPDDLAWALSRLAGRMETRVGQGFDVHRFRPGNQLRLGGVAIPHDMALEGHSDADVALHALTDALLGTIAAGDIGSHFPPSDARWKGADSAIFLAHAGQMVKDRRGEILLLDLTLICEAPRIGPHRAAITARIAEILGIEPGRVSVKATTTEGLGFTGRREGIAAQALASVRFR